MSFSEFTKEDFNLINDEYESFLTIAKERCRNKDEVDRVIKAFEFANQAHRNVRRRSGEPYIIHPINVAKIVISDIGLGYKSICAALLHDVVEDTDYSVEDISNLFGEKIASLVDGLTKIKTVLDNEDRKGGIVTTESMQAENFKRILLTLNDDVRVVLIKLADRLHNCRTIDSMPEHKRDKILSETMFIFVPLAHRLGLYGVKSEMENIWLRYKEPEEYRSISERISKNIAERDKDIDDFIAPIDNALRYGGISFHIKKRIKTPYSIWYKMRTKKVHFEEIFDLYAVRIIFDPDRSMSEKSMAYRIFALLTNFYSENENRRRDWIAHPKNNGYEAFHCTLMSKAGIWIEVQIRSKRMDDIAEKGIAAHWSYKKDGYASENDSKMDKWLGQIQDILLSKDVSALELLDIIHKDLVSSEIVVFTPRGEQKSITAGATALDFAYMIHSNIGNQAIAAKVNMKLVPLSTVLRSGDQVEIITAANAKPQMEWLKFLNSRRARLKVIEYFRSDRDNIAKKGEEIFMERIRMMGQKSDERLISHFLDYCQLKDIKELYFRVGLGILGPEQFKTIIDENKLFKGERKKYVIQDSDKGSIRYKLASGCCNPIPGDPLIGFFIDKNTIAIHTKSCPEAGRLATRYGNRIVAPQWTEIENKDYAIKISLKGIDRLGLLSDISAFISKNLKINMRQLQLNTEDGVFEGCIELLVRDKSVLNDMVNGLKTIDGIQDVVRTDI